jgi:hypothetical protein
MFSVRGFLSIGGVGLLSFGIAAAQGVKPSSHGSAGKPQITYSVRESSNGPPVGVLLATANGRSRELIGQSQQKCLRIVAQQDFDGNGSTDALVANVQGCGGNCCPDSFFFVTSQPNGGFQIGKEFAESWSDPVVEKWDGRWSVVVTSNNEGINTDRPVETTRRFVLEKGQAMAVQEHHKVDIQAIVEMRSEMFANPDETHTIEYDLDEDGRNDVVTGKFWERWGRIIWSVRFANGKEFTSSVGCKRIGVLATRTNGVHDLVCDQDDVLHWTGTRYQ